MFYAYIYKQLINIIPRIEIKIIHTSKVHPFYYNRLDNSGLFAYEAVYLDIDCSIAFDCGLSVTCTQHDCITNTSRTQNTTAHQKRTYVT